METSNVRFNYSGQTQILLDGKPISLTANDKLYLNIPFSVVIKSAQPQVATYYETSFDSGETFTLSNPKAQSLPSGFQKGDYFCYNQICTLVSTDQANFATFYNGASYGT